MDMPNIPDSRPRKSPSLHAHSPGIVLDEAVHIESDNQSAHFSQGLRTPPNEPQYYNRELDAYRSPVRITGDH